MFDVLAPYLFPISVPIIASVIVAKCVYKHELTKGELFLQTVAGVLATVGALWFGAYSALSDTELLNGEVLTKYQDTVSCEHSYQECTGSGKDEKCVTKYEHFVDYDWIVKTSVGNVEIDRVDRQGTDMPKRFKHVVIGEPATVAHSYDNYLKGNPDSLFNYDDNMLAEYRPLVPPYPAIYDYYKVNRVLVVGKQKIRKAVKGWNDYLNQELRVLGSKLQANIIVLVTDNSQDLFRATKYEWDGGKKNDIILGIGVDKDLRVKWFDSTSFMDGFGNNDMHSELRMNGLAHDQISMDLLKSSLAIIVKKFDRHPMAAESEMLTAFSASWGLLIGAAFFGLFVSLILSYVLAHNQVRAGSSGSSSGLFSGILDWLVTLFVFWD